MAFAAPDPNEETPGQGVPQAGQPVSAGGAGLGGSSKAAATPGQNVPAQPSAQLSSYLGANQPQAAALGQNVATSVGNQVNAAGSAIQPAVNIYTGQQYTVPTDAATNAAVASSPSSLTQAQQQSFENELGASAAAPNSADTFEASAPYQTLNTGIQNAVEQANLWNTGNNVADLSTALQPYEGSQATTGDTTLDSLLLSQTPGAYGQIQSAVAPASTLQSQLNAGATQADASLQNAIAQDNAATPAATAAAQQYVTGLNASIANYLANAQSQENAYNAETNTVSTDLANVQPQIAALQNAVAAYNSLVNGGDAAGQWGIPSTLNGVPQTFSPINLASYLNPASPVSGAPTDAQAATSGQYADLSALQALLGQSGLAALNPSVTPSESAQAGTWSVPSTPPSIQALLDPIYNSVIPTDANAIDTMLQYSNGSGQTDPGNTNIQSDLAAAFDATALGATMIGAPPIGAGLGAYLGLSGTGGTDQTGQSANLQTGSPIGASVYTLDNAMTNLALAAGQQPFPGATPTPTPPPGVVPGTLAWDQWETATYPGLNIPGYNPTTNTYTPPAPGTYGAI